MEVPPKPPIFADKGLWYQARACYGTAADTHTPGYCRVRGRQSRDDHP